MGKHGKNKSKCEEKDREYDLSRYVEIDEKIFALSKRVQLLMYLKATNIEEQKDKFLSQYTKLSLRFGNTVCLTTKIKEPKFLYSKPKYDEKTFLDMLAGIKLPGGIMDRVYRQIIEKMLLSNKIVQNRGSVPIVKGASLELYGRPSKTLVKRARSIIKRLGIFEDSSSAKDVKKTLNSKVVSIEMRKLMDKYGLKHWKVVRSRQPSVGVNPARKVLKISTSKMYSKQDIKLLLAHEVFVHAFRAENGYQQPLYIFATGFPTYIATEEGLALYIEERKKVASKRSIARHAMKVIAVDAMLDGMTFSEVFCLLKSFGADNNIAWELTYRVFRGGAFTKDYLYLDGYFKVKRYVMRGQKIRDLYVGKVGIEDIPFVRRLLKSGVLTKPKYFPRMRT